VTDRIPPLGVDEPAAAALRALLEERRGALQEQVRELGESDPNETSNLQFGKRIGDGTAYAIERMTGAFQARTLYETVRQIEDALQRLDEGSYGTCERCGETIPPERLAAVPWTGLCVGCASRSSPRRKDR